MKGKAAIISGISVSYAYGVGEVMQRLLAHIKAEQLPVEIFASAATPTTTVKGRLMPLLELIGAANFARQWFRKLVGLAMDLKLATIRQRNILVIHPQVLGYNRFLRLAKHNRTFLYVMDNGFFCVKSYNNFEGEYEPCFRCLGSTQFEDATTCTPAPALMPSSTNIRYLQQFKEVAKNITFLAQNRLQADLLKQHFGENIDTKVVGIDVSDVHEIRREAMSTGYDFVYHGSAVHAKGIGLVVRMAKLLPARSFLVPADLEDVKQATQLETLPENLTCTAMNWTTGLSEACATCKVVLCPSLWSAPIEISLLKSIAINGCVAVINFSQNYSAELPEDCLIRLSPSIETDIHRLDDIVANDDLRKTLQTRSQKWLEQHNEQAEQQVSEIFDLLLK